MMGNEETTPFREVIKERRSQKAKVIAVIEVDTYIGNGTAENPYRAVQEYWSLDGELLATSVF